MNIGQSDAVTIGEYNEQGELMQGYYYSPQNSLGNAPVAIKHNDNGITQTSYYQNDHLNTPQMLTRPNGAIVWQGQYDAFGEVTQTNTQVSNPIRFPGQYYDQETGLHYNWNRYYDPQTGRYIASDPIGLAGGYNTYAYVGGNPLMYVEPNGLARCTYSISTTSLVCTSNTAHDPNNVGPHEVRSLNPENVHSGRGEHKNNPASANIQDHGPIWPGEFNMTPNEIPGREGWWALREPGWTKLDSLQHKLGLKRAGANLHMGITSYGCITVDSSEEEPFNYLTDLLGREAGDNVLTVVP